MTNTRINRMSAVALLVLSLTASIVPWFLAWLKGFDRPPAADEEAPAHIFQLSIALMVPAMLVYLATADWSRPWPLVRRVALPVTLTALSIAALFYYEHVYAPAHFQ
ncbi:MAG: hypothetical protein R2745_19120 [Vicinamibacterales bacterium]